MHTNGMDVRAHVLRLLTRYAAARGIAVTSACAYSAGQARLADRLRAGRDITSRRAVRIAQWLSDHWPPAAAWPADIPRPTPQSATSTVGVAPREVVRAAREHRDQAMATSDWAAVKYWQGRAVAVAMQLDVRDQIADPTALCEALAVRRYVYDDTVRRYAGHPERRPRPGRLTARVVEALRAAGDRRFVNPHPREAA